MSYLRRRRDKKVCASKVKHPTRQAAIVAARRINGRAYECPGLYGESHHWHVTSRRWR